MGTFVIYMLDMSNYLIVKFIHGLLPHPIQLCYSAKNMSKYFIFFSFAPAKQAGNSYRNTSQRLCYKLFICMLSLPLLFAIANLVADSRTTFSSCIASQRAELPPLRHFIFVVTCLSITSLQTRHVYLW